MAPDSAPTVDRAALQSALSAVVGQSHVRAADGQYGEAGLVVLPASTDEVASVVAICRANGVSIVPQGGLTGLVGGCVSRPDQIALSLTRMTLIDTPLIDTPLIDIGANLTHDSFDRDRDAVLARAREAGVAQMVVTARSPSTRLPEVGGGTMAATLNSVFTISPTVGSTEGSV